MLASVMVFSPVHSNNNPPNPEYRVTTIRTRFNDQVLLDQIARKGSYADREYTSKAA